MEGDGKLARNPAWRPAQSHSETLASISHHFLGDGRSAGGREEPSAVNRIPVLLAMDPDHPRDALQPEPVVEALTRELNLPLYEAAEARWEAYATEEPAEVDPQVTRFVLVLATASQAGTRLAYQRIKQLPRAESRRVGVLLSGAKEPELARRCQGRLAEGALAGLIGIRRWLGQRLGTGFLFIDAATDAYGQPGIVSAYDQYREGNLRKGSGEGIETGRSIRYEIHHAERFL